MTKHHYQHENRGVKLQKEFIEANRFDKKINKLVPIVGQFHMKMHCLKNMRSTKIIEFFRSIPSTLFDDFVNACDCDHVLSNEQVAIIELFKKTMKTTVIDIPKETLKDREKTRNFVHREYVKTFDKLKKEL